MKNSQKKCFKISWKIKSIFLVTIVFASFAASVPASAYTPPQPVNPQSTVVGLTGTIPSPPPQVSATIAAPSNNQTFSSSAPYTVTGICQSGLLIKLFVNNVFAGAAECINGSYTITASLFNGQNTLVVRDYDALDQQGPDSNIVNVFYNNPNLGSSQGVTLTSNYAKLGVDPGATLSWPIAVTGGSPSYALSVVWGDGKPDSLLSQNSPGSLDISHIYDTSGIYTILVKATDAQGNVAYLQLVGLANGPASQVTASTALNKPTTPAVKGIKLTNTTLFIITAVVIIMPAATFWLGSRHRLVNIKKRFESGEGL